MNSCHLAKPAKCSKVDQIHLRPDTSRSASHACMQSHARGSLFTADGQSIRSNRVYARLDKLTWETSPWACRSQAKTAYRARRAGRRLFRRWRRSAGVERRAYLGRRQTRGPCLSRIGHVKRDGGRRRTAHRSGHLLERDPGTRGGGSAVR